MPKGLFTGCTIALFESAPTLDAITDALAEHFEVRGRASGTGESPWIGGPSVALEIDAGADGLASVDVIAEPWPDTMGDPQKQPDLFAAWTMAALGPFTFPGGLGRALDHAMRWKDAKARVPAHRAFARVRSSYVLGKGGDAPILPEDYDPMAELFQITAITRALLDLPGAVGYFDPSGEVVLDAASLDQSMSYHQENSLPPFDVWSNLRYFEVGDEDGWALLDTIGMDQLEVADQEACFPIATTDGDAVAVFLRKLSLYLLQNGPVIRTGHSVDGPGGPWRAIECEESLAPAPRRTLRWFPASARRVPAGLMKTTRGES